MDKKKPNFCYKIKYTLHIYGLQYLSQYWTFNKNVFPKGDTEHSRLTIASWTNHYFGEKAGGNISREI